MNMKMAMGPFILPVREASLEPIITEKGLGFDLYLIHINADVLSFHCQACFDIHHMETIHEIQFMANSTGYYSEKQRVCIFSGFIRHG